MAPSTPESRRRKTTTRKRANGQVDAGPSNDAAVVQDNVQKRAKIVDEEDTVVSVSRWLD